ncbi:SDR family NAD(P)-dependent oxidoreductase [Azospirillum melinis]|uniref:SDR family NAD(P)-dependent oxidoreductase n=1 Tax=Azospirillum melinis TaxID=328839 RepID=A0ABX2KRG8_9PROT|nr:SDR family NAD(P)-dependent oxidoreductase [Azospirillum melinis]MBP2309802.1 NAD(P)-dependent dehydrogenase (short-subunit alcohol dehydrogenase family) [Azospirillum melinis]NUB04091.1 SDR family NAD(P)-dependent oxidoreductase [Azospirillum melinis]
MQTILITGTSSGFGLEMARHFLARNWRVVATMRRPDPELLPRSDALRILPLDVTSEESIAAAVEAAGPIDVVVNNAGVGVVGAFEATPMAHIRKLFETNTFGVMSMCQAVIPQMRERRSGVIVNVTSSVTLAALPLAAAYTASKQAIKGFTGSLAHELGHFGIRAKLVEPGYGPTTAFSRNAGIVIQDLIPPAYMDFAKPIFDAYASPAATTTETDVAEAVSAAIDDLTGRLHFPAGADSIALYNARFA